MPDVASGPLPGNEHRVSRGTRQHLLPIEERDQWWGCAQRSQVVAFSTHRARTHHATNSSAVELIDWAAQALRSAGRRGSSRLPDLWSET